MQVHEQRGEKKTSPGGRKKRKLQKFTTQMREDLTKGKWLTDEHTNLAQSLLKAQFPHINGLQSTDWFVAEQHEALQIHFVAGNHWVASSSFGKEVAVYDSKSPPIAHSPACSDLQEPSNRHG